MKKRSRPPLRFDRRTNSLTPALWAARLEKCRELKKKLEEVKQLRKQLHGIEVRLAQGAATPTAKSTE
ncbi:MAG: hypothetical protein KGK16_05395 [Bradyrhizobium sp.]|nr:hypothetical protein [Bradyrhizobium sp.]